MILDGPRQCWAPSSLLLIPEQYRPEALLAYPDWSMGPLETLEGLEQLRFMENGRKVLCVEVEARGRQFWELNNPEDVPKLEPMMADMGVE